MQPASLIAHRCSRISPLVGNTEQQQTHHKEPPLIIHMLSRGNKDL